jgi:hypothetical protein
MNTESLVTYTKGSRPFLCTPAQAETLDRLITIQKGGIGTIHGYKPSTGYTKPPSKNINFITRFSIRNLYDRKIKALEAIAFDDVAEYVKNDPVLSVMDHTTLKTLFAGRKAQELESLIKTNDGDRSDGYRKGHDRCYVTVADGVKVNLDCRKENGIMEPVLFNGLPVAETIMLFYLELSSTTVVEGERKVVNSGASVRMKNCIERCLNKRSVGIKTFSLKADNFESITINRENITPDDIAGSPQATLLLEALDF